MNQKEEGRALELKDVKTLVLIAALNEEKAIGPTLVELSLSLNRFTCLVIDGQSYDRTVDVAKSNMVEVVFQNGLGKGDAIATGLEYAKTTDIKYEYVAMIDADCTYPAKYFPAMIKILDENHDVGMVCGNRFDRLESKAMPSQFFLGNRILAFTHKLMNGVKLRDPLTGLRVIRREVMNNWVPRSKGFDIEVELNNLVKKKGYGVVEIPIEYRRRIGEKKLKPIHGFRILKRIMLQSFSSQ